MCPQKRELDQHIAQESTQWIHGIVIEEQVSPTSKPGCFVHPGGFRRLSGLLPPAPSCLIATSLFGLQMLQVVATMVECLCNDAVGADDPEASAQLSEDLGGGSSCQALDRDSIIKAGSAAACLAAGAEAALKRLCAWALEANHPSSISSIGQELIGGAPVSLHLPLHRVAGAFLQVQAPSNPCVHTPTPLSSSAATAPSRAVRLTSTPDPAGPPVDGRWQQSGSCCCLGSIPPAHGGFLAREGAGGRELGGGGGHVRGCLAACGNASSPHPGLAGTGDPPVRLSAQLAPPEKRQRAGADWLWSARVADPRSVVGPQRHLHVAPRNVLQKRILAGRRVGRGPSLVAGLASGRAGRAQMSGLSAPRVVLIPLLLPAV